MDLKLLFSVPFLISFVCIILLYVFRWWCRYSAIAASAADSIFMKNTWENNYMLGIFKFTPTKECNFDQYINEFEIRQEYWQKSQRWFRDDKISGIFEIDTQNNSREIIESLNGTVPPLIDNKLLPYKIYCLKKSEEIVLLLNHYHCDGLILHDIVVFNLLNTEKTINFYRYTYIPIYSDFMLLKYGVESGLKLFDNRPRFGMHQKSIVVNKVFHYDSINRWKVFSNILTLLFNYTIKDEIRVAFTAGFDDCSRQCKNRIGLIIVDIPRLKPDEYENFIKKKILEHQKDAMTSYDFVRNFPTHHFRNKLNSCVDVVLTSFKIEGTNRLKYSRVDNIDYNTGTFIGIGKIPLYILAVTQNYSKKINVSIKSTSPDLDTDAMLRNESNIKKVYEWPAQNKSTTPLSEIDHIVTADTGLEQTELEINLESEQECVVAS